MPSIDENKAVWDGGYDWSRSGEEWSIIWGAVDTQWYGSLLPRIQRFLPAATVLEIAPGFGRWSHFLREHAKRLILVDLSEACMRGCHARFSSDPRVEYHLNDGKSLDFLPDDSVDFVFSFDSLVHAEADVLEAYVTQLGRKLKRDGVGFIHHSNVGAFERYYHFAKNFPFARNLLSRLRILDNVFAQWRAPTMSAEKFRRFADNAGLSTIGQELIEWDSRRLIDCMSTFTKKGSIHDRPNVVVENRHMMREAKHLKDLGRIYARPPAPGRPK